MPTRPVQGGSNGTWGTELNAWLDAHTANGTAATGRSDIGPSVFFDWETTGTGNSTTSGTSASPPRGACFGYFLISSDNIAQTGDWGYANGWSLEHHYGGAAATGGRQTLFVQSFYDGGTMAGGGTNHTNHFYAATQTQWTGTSNDGGSAVGPTYQGAGFGLGSIATMNATATYYANLSAGEFDVLNAAGTHVRYLSGIQVVGDLLSNADVYDCGIALSGLGPSGHIGFQTGFLIGDMNGAAALASTSTLMQVINHSALAKGFDFSGTDFSTYLLNTKSGFKISAPAGDHLIDIGRQDGSSSSPQIRFHSNSTAAGWDVLLMTTGGTGVNGNGFLTIQTAELALNGQNTGFAPLVVNAITGQTADIADFQVASATKLAILASGQLKTIAGNEATGAGTPALGANFPGTVTTAPYKWLKFTASDGTQVYVPAWK